MNELGHLQRGAALHQGHVGGHQAGDGGALVVDGDRGDGAQPGGGLGGGQGERGREGEGHHVRYHLQSQL